MKPCVLFNPAARSEKAAEFRKRLESLRLELELRETTSAESARNLARIAVGQGFNTVVAVGGDGTFNEVLNGVGADPKAFESVRLGILPLGTVNVFAKELGLPLDLDAALDVLRRGNERSVDLAVASFQENDRRVQRYFGQLGGAGLDSRAIELVDWESKKRFGAFAYIKAGLKAIVETQVKLTVSNGSESLTGEMVLIGNGRYYGGKVEIFPKASLTDGLLHAVVFERVHWADLVWRGWGLFTQTISRQDGVRVLRGSKLELWCDRAVPFQLEGDLVGKLPCSFEVLPQTLRMIVP
ncbi:MAG: putative lipid kinase BmrU [Verrucomicrobia subdivision 3 bacterium]|nr:putative lipid kinase BmrU [Limisphaerales bacterium]MCS1412498.1 putative lipid kinase BmrU [Limisphaerales bacterium]